MSAESTSKPGAGKTIFMTGASGYIGSVITEFAIADGYTVRGLSRSEKNDAKIKALGGIPVRGDLSTLDVLSRESKAADIVFHLAFNHDFTIDYNIILKTDGAAVDAMAEPLCGTDKPFVISAGCANRELKPGQEETDEDSPFLQTLPIRRDLAEKRALDWADKGVRVSSNRLPPYVYGRAGHGFLFMQMQVAAKLRESLYAGDGKQRTSFVHVEDAARMYFLMADKAKPGEAYNCVSSTTVSQRDVAEAVGEMLGVPVRSVPVNELAVHFPLAVFLNVETRASSKKAKEQLGWEPKAIDVISDIKTGSYTTLKEKLLSGQV